MSKVFGGFRWLLEVFSSGDAFLQPRLAEGGRRCSKTSSGSCRFSRRGALSSSCASPRTYWWARIVPNGRWKPELWPEN